MDGPVSVGTVVAVSHAGGRQHPSPSRSAPFRDVMLNCADMLRSSLLAHMCVCACSGQFSLFCFFVFVFFFRCCLQLTVYCCAVMLRFASSFHRIYGKGRTHTRVPAHITVFTGCYLCRRPMFSCTCPSFFP